MKPKAVYMEFAGRTGWFLLNWTAPKGGMLIAPTLGSLIDAARSEEAAKGMMEQRTVQFSRLAMRISRVNLFDMAKDEYARDIHRRGFKHSGISWYETMASRYQLEPFERVSQVTFYAQVSPEPTRQPSETHSHNEVTNAE